MCDCRLQKEGTGVGRGDSTGSLLQGEVLNSTLKPHALRKERKLRLGAKFPLQSCVLTHGCSPHPFLLSLCLPLPPCDWGLESPRISDTDNGFP